jgi:hypothetical protein
MIHKQATSINEVITILDNIIEEATLRKDPLGYFAALYRQVTIKVKDEIERGFFEDGPRMETLDVVFANRYIVAYYSYKNNQSVTQSWQKAFDLSTKFWPIVLQHLLIGMNAHISLDLGIAAAQISQDKDLEMLKNDFIKINAILASQVVEVEEKLSKIWPTLKRILKFTNKVDDFLIDFSMEIARDNAWEFAQLISKTPQEKLNSVILTKDERVSKASNIISNPGMIVTLVFGVIKLMERSTINSKIETLQD